MGCLICGDPNGATAFANNQYHVNCPRCGNGPIITETALQKIRNIDQSQDIRKILSRELRKRSRTYVTIDSNLMDQVLVKYLMTPLEKVDALLVYWGDRVKSNPDWVPTVDSNNTALELMALMEMPFLTQPGEIRSQLESIMYLGSTRESMSGAGYFYDPSQVKGITYKGWQRYHELTSVSSEEKKQAFFAFKFPDDSGAYELLPEVIELYNHVSERSQGELGVRIWNPLYGSPKGGLINARMEVEIRRSLFVVAELSHGNQGAYWEAGFAHGLGLPVIYLHNTTSSERVHFDTNAHLRVMWTKESIKQATDKLFDTIRATIPGKVIV